MTATVNAYTTSGVVVTSDTSGSLALQTGGTTALTIDTSQNVGIGTSSPSTVFHTAGANGSYATTLAESATYAKLRFQNTSVSSLSLFQGLVNSSNATWYLQVANGPGTGSYDIALNPFGNNVGIGLTNPSSILHISSANPIFKLTNTSSNDTPYLQAGVSGDGYMYVSGGSGRGVKLAYNAGTVGATLDASGNLLLWNTDSSITATNGIKFINGASGNAYMGIVNSASTNSTGNYNLYSTGASAYRFYVGMGGTVYATSTTITAISDQRLKENIRDLDEGLATVMALKPRKFDWKEGKGQNIKNARGFIAQEFETVLPDMIEEWRDPAPEGEEAYKAINANLIPVLVKAIQELSTQITELKAEVQALKGA